MGDEGPASRTYPHRAEILGFLVGSCGSGLDEAKALATKVLEVCFYRWQLKFKGFKMMNDTRMCF